MSTGAGLLDYVTYKYVVLKDRRLGLAYYILAVSIVLYIVTEVVIRKGYLQIDTNPQGTIRAILSEELSNDFRTDGSHLPSPSQLSYCQSNRSYCSYVDPLELNWPVEGRAVTIATFVKEKHQKLPSKSNSQQSVEYEDITEEQYFTLVQSDDPYLISTV